MEGEVKLPSSCKTGEPQHHSQQEKTELICTATLFLSCAVQR